MQHPVLKMWFHAGFDREHHCMHGTVWLRPSGGWHVWTVGMLDQG